MVPFAQIAHATVNRLRLKITGRRGDGAYFADVEAKLESALAPCTVQANPMTGSVVICAGAVNSQRVSDFGRDEGLFRVQAPNPNETPVALSFISPLQVLNRNVKAATGGRLDLPGTVFMVLILHGIIEIVKGNWRSPPWYTAFWYASGLYSKTLLEKAAAMQNVDAGKE